MTADIGHTDDPAIQTNDAYLARVKAIVVEIAATAPKGMEGESKNLWGALVKRADISQTLEELLGITDSRPELFHGAVRRLLNTISHEYNIVVHGPEVHDSTPAVISASLHDYTVPLVVKVKPDRQVLMGTHRHLLKVSLQRLSFPAMSAVNAIDSGAVTESSAAADLAAGITIERDAAPVPPLRHGGESTTGQTELSLTGGELLRHAHRDGWVPGLLLYLELFPQSNAKIEPKIGDKTRMRFKEILHVGKLTSPGHILEVVYDLDETRLRMLESDVLHRDISWFNVMCQAEHHPATNATQVLAGIPCVKNIFGDENGEPAALLVDLDHAAHADRIWKHGYETGIERVTGTPMFVALELSGVDDHNRVNYTEALSKANFKGLTQAFDEVESHADVFQRAFPDGSGKIFMENFAKVVAREKVRRKAYPPDKLYSDPREVHRAHHDVQSIYWTLLWSFAGALPKGSEAYSKAYLDSFCHFMLTHELGYEGDRLRFLRDVEGCRAFLHARLRHFARLFRSLALYLSIPWHVYVRDGTVKIDHAHHAIRRLLLRELIFLRTPDGKKLNLMLDTTQPRMYMTKSITDHRQTLIPNQLRTAVATTQGTGTKRKFEQTSMDSQCEARDAKRSKVGEALAEEENYGKAQAQPRSAKVLQENTR